MKKFRICKNKYNIYKIQAWSPPRTLLFGLLKIKGRWKDTCFNLQARSCVKFDTRKQAEDMMDQYIKIYHRSNNSWKCDM